MAKNKVSEWSSTPSNNTDIGGIDIAEGCAPSGINNGIREMMAQVKDMQAGLDGDNFTVGGNLTVNGTSTFTGAISLGTDLPITDGGTGASTASDARTNLGLGTIATQAANNVAITGGSITGITDITVADGGTGVSSLTANNVILGNGTSPVQFVAPSTSGNVLTSNGTTWTSAALGAIGQNQTWQNPSRSHGTSYQNTTGKPIMVNYGGSSGAKNVWVYLQVSTDNSNWVTVAQAFTSADDDINGGCLSAIVPDGMYYRSAGTPWGNPLWAELR